jgi:hypothetical protein
MANELQICPPTWNAAMGSVLRTCVQLTARSRDVHPSLLINMQYPATKKNWMMVIVTGNRKLVMMTLPVFDDSAEDVYHSTHSATKRIVSVLGTVRVGMAKGFGAGEEVREGDS